MKRLCFLGNSHVAAVRAALNDMRAEGGLEDVEVDVFGSQRNSLRTATVRNGVVGSSSAFVQKNFRWTSGGMSEVEIARYDEIIILAGISVFSSAHYQAGPDLPTISSEMADAIITHHMEQDWAIGLARLIAEASGSVQVSFVGSPLISVDSPRAQKFLAQYHDRDTGVGVRARNLRTMIDRSVVARSAGNFRMKAPPAAALEDSGFFTRSAYCKGSMLFKPEVDAQHPGNDFVHMNAQYGRLLLQDALG